MICMEKRDARLLSSEAQAEVRRQAVKLRLKGMPRGEVAEVLGVHPSEVTRFVKLYEQGGWAALKLKARGRKPGSGQRLTAEQEEHIQKLIVDKTPDQLKMRYALWTREAVRRLIIKEFGVEYSLQAMSVILHRWGFTPQKPVKKAYEQRPAEVQRWLDETYPQVAARAKAEGAEIWWADETAVKPEAHRRRGFSPRGHTPVVIQTAKRFHSSLISAINNQGKLEWLPLSKPINAEILLGFLKQLIKNRNRKVIVILDNLRVHHSAPVKAWVQEHKNQIELIFLPSYSPELNPDEYLNNHLKQTLSREGPALTKGELDQSVNLGMSSLVQRPELVASFFNHPKASYAA